MAAQKIVFSFILQNLSKSQKKSIKNLKKRLIVS